MIRYLVYIILGCAILTGMVWAGNGTVNVLQGGGSPTTYQTTTNGTGSNLGNEVICDQIAGAACATVDQHQLLVAATQSGTWNLSASVTITSVAVTNTVSVSPTGNTPVTFSGTVSTSPTGTTPVSPTGNTPITGSVGVTGTVSTSPTGNTPITGSVGVTGTVSTSPTGNTPITGSVGVTGTVSTSPTGTTPTSIIGTVSTSPTGNTPITGTIAATQSGNWQIGLGTTSTSPIFNSITNTVSVSPTGTTPTSPTGNTPVTGTVAATQSGNWQVGLGTTQSSPIFSQLTTSTSAIGSVTVLSIGGTVSTSPTGTTPTSPTGSTPVTGTINAAQSGNWSVGLATLQSSPIFAQLTTSTSAIGSVTVFNTVTISTASATQPTSPTGTTPVSIAATVSTSPVGTTPISGIVNAGSGFTGTIGNPVATSGVYGSARAQSSEITAAGTGNLVGLVTDLVGKLIVSPYANKENILTWTASSTTSTSGGGAGLGNVLIPALGAGVYPYITSLSCYITQPNTSQIITVAFSNANTNGLSIIYRAMVSGPTSQNANFPATFPTPLGGVSMGAVNSNTQVVYKGTDGGTLAGGLIGCNAGGYKGT